MCVWCVVESSSLDSEACGSIPNAPKFTCADFGAKRFILARDMAANVLYYMMGNLVHSYVGSPSRLPDTRIQPHWVYKEPAKSLQAIE